MVWLHVVTDQLDYEARKRALQTVVDVKRKSAAGRKEHDWVGDEGV